MFTAGRAALASLGVLALVASLVGCAAMAPKPTAPVIHHASYELGATWYSQQSGLSVAIDPQVFEEAKGTPPEIGPEAITHAKDVRPVRATSAAGTPLLSAHGAQLGITLGQWQQASGTVAFSCVNGNERAVSTLSGLIPRGQYSLFVMNQNANQATALKPWGDSAGTTNNFSADANGLATVTNTVSGCLGKTEAAVIVWHSDGEQHGATPGVLGVTWHNSLVAPLP